MTNWIQKIQDCNISQQPLPKVIIRAEPTLARLLRTLDADNIKMVCKTQINFLYFQAS